MLASVIIDKAQVILKDDGTYWSDAELLGWLNDGQKEICKHKPEESTSTTNFQLVAGCKQTITGHRLVAVTRNVNGNAVRVIAHKLLDELIPDWHLAANGAVKYFTYNPEIPNTFYVYPPSTGLVQITVAVNPATIASTSSAITIDDIYEAALVNYLLYRSFSKDADYAGDEGRANQYYKKFMESL